MPPLQSLLSHMVWVFSIAGPSTDDTTASSKHKLYFKIVKIASLSYGDWAPIFHLAFGSVLCFSVPTELCAFFWLMFFSILSLPSWKCFLYVFPWDIAYFFLFWLFFFTSSQGGSLQSSIIPGNHLRVFIRNISHIMNHYSYQISVCRGGVCVCVEPVLVHVNANDWHWISVSTVFHLIFETKSFIEPKTQQLHYPENSGVIPDWNWSYSHSELGLQEFTIMLNYSHGYWASKPMSLGLHSKLFAHWDSSPVSTSIILIIKQYSIR